MDLMQWSGIGIAVLVSLGLVSVAHWLLTHQLRKVWSLADPLVTRCRISAYVAAGAIGVNASLPSPHEMEDRALYGPISHMLDIAMIISITWLATSVAYAITDGILSRLAISNGDADRRSRRLQTQVRLMRRIITGVIVVLATAAVLFTFDAVRPLGAGLLTSAGLLGIVAGVAAQSTLGNLFAGLQLTFSDALRINDIIVFEEEWGRVEELSLTNVTLRIWDERRLVIPVSEFTGKAFENWTKEGTSITGAVLLRVDWEVPIDEIRAEVGAFVTQHPLWDGRRWSVQATDILEDGSGIVLRAVATTADSDARWDLCCDLREHMINYLVQYYPQGLPRRRTEFVAQVGDGGSEEPALASLAPTMGGQPLGARIANAPRLDSAQSGESEQPKRKTRGVPGPDGSLADQQESRGPETDDSDADGE